MATWDFIPLCEDVELLVKDNLPPSYRYNMVKGPVGFSLHVRKGKPVKDHTCVAITTRGKRCKLEAAPGSSFCEAHTKMCDS